MCWGHWRSSRPPSSGFRSKPRSGNERHPTGTMCVRLKSSDLGGMGAQQAANEVDVFPKTVEKTSESGWNRYLADRAFDARQLAQKLLALFKIIPISDRL